ncbi:MAG: sigma-70 family RNA polymerase sigma factor [Thermoanaerobaculia bacterium]|nr:sigma-70 family RNA polymerase sigma factor [Thermoanaerobaculia bacterium]
MTSSSPGHVTRLFSRWRSGEERAEEELLPLVYQELRGLAANHLRRERAHHTLQPTELVHEAFLRLFGSQVEALDRVHFFALASQVMRRVLVDHARRQLAQKRIGPEDRVTLHTDSGVTPESQVDVLDLHRALERFAKVAPRPAQLVELRFFGGLTLDEAAEVAEISRATAARDWEAARIWLSGELAA